MKLSELIDHLEKAKSAHGDLECFLTTSRSGDCDIESITLCNDATYFRRDGELTTVSPPFMLITAED